VASSAKKTVESPPNPAMQHGPAPLDFRQGALRRVYAEPQETYKMPPDDASGRDVARSRPLEYYEAIARASQSMLDAARGSDWNEVERLEQRCRTLIEALNEASLRAPLRPNDNRRRMELLQRILADDAQIRDCTDPWLKQLERLISSPRGRR
jgi:flagellar protein FliT